VRCIYRAIGGRWRDMEEGREMGLHKEGKIKIGLENIGTRAEKGDGRRNGDKERMEDRIKGV
jgi:hypothetical protein